MSRSGTTLSSQRSEYTNVRWNNHVHYGNTAYINHGKETGGNHTIFRNLSTLLNTTTQVLSRPANLVRHNAMPDDNGRKPYWTFSYELNSTNGFILSNINVKDTVNTGSTEDVFDKIEFKDFKIFFTDGSSTTLNVGSLLTSNDSHTHVRLSVSEDGTGQNFSGGAFGDTLYQRGLSLEITTNALAASGGTCRVKIGMSIVFRGAKNDFDPGGVPVALVAWPQFTFMWFREGATKRVKKFMGSIKIAMKNKMHSSHMHHGSPLNENIAGFYTDSNTSIRDSNFDLRLTTATDRATYYSGARADFSAVARLPFGWAMVFDYLSDLNLNLNSSTNVVTQRETEIIAVYGPDDGTKHTSSRANRYEWIPGVFSPGLRVKKAPRQGMYDNMHNHARMSSLDAKGNVQIHAPFCGHSCVHTHWRWSNISSWGYFSDTPKYKGWGASGAFSEHDAPKVPPNQKVRIAICRTTANPGNNGNSHSDARILNPASLGTLDPLAKLFWYRAEIISPNADELQVAMEQGIGWAYRYSSPSESSAVKGLTRALLYSLPSSPSQHDLAVFFENSVYPTFRYKGAQDQIPQGSHSVLYNGSGGTSMEDL